MTSTSAPLSITQQFERYVCATHRDDLRKMLLASDPRAPYAVHVDALKLITAIPVLGNAMLHRPLALVPAMDEALRSAQGTLFRATQEKAATGDEEKYRW